MSFELVEWAFDQKVDDSAAKLTLLAIARHADSDGKCWPSVKRISDITGLSASTIKRKLKVLEALGLVKHQRRKGDNGRNSSNIYTVGYRAMVTHTIGHSDPLISNRNQSLSSSILLGHGDPIGDEDKLEREIEKWK